jgi:hypothetical protein
MIEGALAGMFEDLAIETLDKPLVIEYLAYLKRIAPEITTEAERIKHLLYESRLTRRLFKLQLGKE